MSIIKIFYHISDNHDIISIKFYELESQNKVSTIILCHIIFYIFFLKAETDICAARSAWETDLVYLALTVSK